MRSLEFAGQGEHLRQTISSFRTWSPRMFLNLMSFWKDSPPVEYNSPVAVKANASLQAALKRAGDVLEDARAASILAGEKSTPAELTPLQASLEHRPRLITETIDFTNLAIRLPLNLILTLTLRLCLLLTLIRILVLT